MFNLKFDVINEVKLFLTVYHWIYCRKFLTLSKHKSCYKIKCIRIHVFNWNSFELNGSFIFVSTLCMPAVKALSDRWAGSSESVTDAEKYSMIDL